jgi:hypothetical protein
VKEKKILIYLHTHLKKCKPGYSKPVVFLKKGHILPKKYTGTVVSSIFIYKMDENACEKIKFYIEI